MRTKAARLVSHGGPLVVHDVDLGGPPPGEVVVEMAYAAINPVDRYIALGAVAPGCPLPRTIGTEGAGRLDGRWVVLHGYGLGQTRDGLWAGAAVVPADAPVPVPEGVDPVVAATMGIAGATAWRAVTELGTVSSDDRVLVLGASGGVGSMIVSLVRSAGATVWAQTGDPAKEEWVGSNGPDQVVVAASAGELGQAVRTLEPTVVFDPLGGEFTGAAVEALVPHGRLVLFGTSAGPEGTVPLRALYRKGITVFGYAGLVEQDDVIGRAIAGAMDAARAGQLVATVDSVVPLSEVNEALARLADRKVRGKLVLNLQG